MRITLCLCCLCFFSAVLPAQTTIGGIINDYAAVQEIVNADCAATLSINEATAFSPGDKVLLLQMKGATVAESDNAAFGTIIALNSAGLYEFNEVSYLSGNEVTLAYPLINAYAVTAGVQLIRVPVYEQAEVTATLTAKAWDGETGGVLALEVQGTLSLSANIDVSGHGFRGGLSETVDGNDCSWLSQQDSYFYGANDWRGASKGEGIATLPVSKQYGKGPQANGGGGGNDHNSGGGGGALFSAGGQGGENDEPSFFGCDGNHPGLGGNEIINSENRLFLGGGGGAGHENNEVGTDGGNGGGIVLILTDSLISNGQNIAANGATPVDGGGDGAGGGGAAGMVLILADDVSDDLKISVNGGDGGFINNNNAERCHGPGGGGSGGRVLLNFPVEASFDVLTNGGAAGIGVQSSSCADGSNGAAPGEAGTVENIEALVFSGDYITLPVAGFEFTYTGPNSVQFSNTSLNYEFLIWNFANIGNSTAENPEFIFPEPGTYEITLIAGTACASDTIIQYITIEATQPLIAAFSSDTVIACAPIAIQFTNLSSGTYDSLLWTFPGGSPANSNQQNPLISYASPGVYDVQLDLFGPDGNTQLIEPDYLEILPAAIANFTYTLNDNLAVFTNLSDNSTNFQWDFGDGTAGTSVENPSHTFGEPGTYEVLLIAASQCGSDTATQLIVIEPVNPLIAAYSFDDGNGCAPHVVQFLNQSSGNYDSLLWTFEGGMPATSTAQNPIVLYEIPGSYDLQLELFASDGSTALISETELLEVLPPVEAIFAYNIDDNTVDFINLSLNASNYQWDFGDGSPFSTEENPSHTYSIPGAYNVTLIATGPYCGKAITESIFVDFTSGTENYEPTSIQVFPNPTSGVLRVFTPEDADYSPVLRSLTGTRLKPLIERYPDGFRMDLRSCEAGIYLLILHSPTDNQAFKVVKID